MARYGRTPARATAPKKKRKKKVSARRAKPKAAEKKKKRRIHRVVKARKVPFKKAKKRKTVKVAAKKRARKTSLYKPTRPSKKPSKKKPLKKAAKKPSTRTARKKQKPARSTKKLTRQLASIRQAEQKKAPKKKRKAAKRAFERARTDAALTIHRLPTLSRNAGANALWNARRDKFRKFLGIATATKQMPARERLRVAFNFRMTFGHQRRVMVRRVLTPSNVEQILYKVDQKLQRFAGRFPLWSAYLTASAYGEKLFGSGAKTLELSPDNEPDEDAIFFQAQGFESTGVWRTLEGMRGKLRSLLEEFAEAERTIVYVWWIIIRNFDFK